MTRIELMQEICKEFPNGKGVEVGVYRAEFSKEILDIWNGTLYMVDLWDNVLEGYSDASNNKGYFEGIIKSVLDNIKGYECRGIMIRAASEKAVELFADNSLDFVYIDANHAYDYVVQDIELWYPKVKKGGYLCGHDYIAMDWYNDPNFLPNKKDKHIYIGDFYNGVFGVNAAVDEFCKKYGYELKVTSEWFGSWIIKKE